MECTELRIGNWVSHTPSKNETTEANFIVSEINKFSANTINGLDAECCQPIPLTEEWLLKFGYRKKPASIVGCDYDCGHGIVRVIKYNERIRTYRNWSNEDRLNGFSWGKTRIEYVHQLQNLYFALTGKELTLNN